MCSPALLNTPNAPLKTLDDLKRHRLLHSHYRKNDWSDWLTAMGRPDLANHQESMVFSSSILTYQAAIDGLGVAIGQVGLLEQELDKGILVCPFDRIVRRKLAYYLLIPQRESMPKKVRIFRDWLLDEIRRMPASATAAA